MSFVFWILAAITVAGGLAAVTLKNTVHCALALTAAFAGLALMFLELDAQFAGFAQILVYIGAVAILLVFAILLTRGAEEKTEKSVFSRTWFTGLVIAAAVFAVLAWAVLHSGAALPDHAGLPGPAPQVTVAQIGNALMGRYVLPLEIVALLLTAAMIGAVLVAMHEKGEPK
ncbi:MAG TPA: NADH-quinone oxidoreductase subunit J [Terracidiphilus sp.]|nr:NADH-quinone oxidoreductase subunit J [Terracidiphilus sp.]